MQRIATPLGLFAAAAAVLIAAPGAAADPAVELSQNSGLAPGQAITVNLAGLPANMQSVAVGQCKPTIVSPTDCNLTGSLLGRADEQGVWQPNGGNRTITLVGAVGGTDCTAAAGACTVSVTSLTEPSRILASAPLTFGAADRPAAPTTTVAAAESADSGDDGDGNGALIAGAVVATVVVIAAGAAVALRRRKGGR